MAGPDQTQQSVSALSARLERSRGAVMEAIADLDEEGFRARHTGGCSAAEALAHLLRAEGVQTAQVRAAVAGEEPSAANERQGQTETAGRMLVPQVLHGLLAQRRDTLRLLSSLSQEQLSRRVSHRELGEITLAALFQSMAEHEEEHAARLRASREGAA